MTEQQPLVSVVIPCFNHAQFIQETIQSVIDQDYQNIELIIIDDGSKDKSVEVIQEMVPACEKRFTRFEFRYRPNKGLSATLNEALKWCEGVYFAPLASDDLIKTYKTSIQVTYLENNPDSIGVFGGICIFKNNGTTREVVRRNAKYRFTDILIQKHNLPAPTQLLRMEAIKKIGGYKEGLIIEDWSTWLFLTENGGTLDYIATIFAYYRRHSDNLSGKFEVMHKGRMQIINLYKDNINYNKALAMVLLTNAYEIKKNDFGKSFKLILNSIRAYPFCIFSKLFILIVIR